MPDAGGKVGHDRARLRWIVGGLLVCCLLGIAAAYVALAAQDERSGRKASASSDRDRDGFTDDIDEDPDVPRGQGAGASAEGGCDKDETDESAPAEDEEEGGYDPVLDRCIELWNEEGSESDANTPAAFAVGMLGPYLTTSDAMVAVGVKADDPSKCLVLITTGPHSLDVAQYFEESPDGWPGGLGQWGLGDRVLTGDEVPTDTLSNAELDEDGQLIPLD